MLSERARVCVTFCATWNLANIRFLGEHEIKIIYFSVFLVRVIVTLACSSCPRRKDRVQMSVALPHLNVFGSGA